MEIMTIGNGKLNDIMEQLRKKAFYYGAYEAEFIKVEEIPLDASFRTLCESNACGNYGKNYTCPPDAGDIYDLMKEIKEYQYVMVYQTISLLEDSYDFEGMMEAMDFHNELVQELWNFTDELGMDNVLHLGAGGCHLCEVCGKRQGIPCRNPKRAIRSLEAYGINVSLLASLVDMNYINGQNTVTYFGAVFMK